MDNTYNRLIDNDELSQSTSLTHLLNGEDNIQTMMILM